MEWLFTILIFGGVIAVTAVLFALWLVVALLKFAGRAVGGLLRAVLPAPVEATEGIRCAHRDCLAVNADPARFCRRCGRQLRRPQHVSVRRAAVW